MTRKISLTLAGVAILLSVLACNGVQVLGTSREIIRGSGTVVEQERTLEGITGVEFDMQGTLYIEIGSSESLRISAEDNLLDYIQSEVVGDRLVISTKPGYNISEKRPITFYLTVVSLDEISINSSGDVEAGDLTAQDFKIELASSGDLKLGSLECDSLLAHVYSSGDASLAGLNAGSIIVDLLSSGDLEIQGGQVDEQDLTLTSSGNYEAPGLSSARVRASLSSSGSATIRVSDSLNGNISSSGDINYIGDPSVDVSSSSSGRVKQLDD